MQLRHKPGIFSVPKIRTIYVFQVNILLALKKVTTDIKKILNFTPILNIQSNMIKKLALTNLKLY